MGKAVKTAGLAGATGGASLAFTGAGKDLLFGKKTPGTADEIIDLASAHGRSLQEQALGEYGSMLKQDTSDLARREIVQKENQARAGAEDQLRKANQLVAQRGMGGSASGINALLNSNRDIGDRIGDIRSQQPALERNLKQQNLSFASGGINSILNEQGQSRIFKQGQQAQGRGGGLVGALAPMAGTIAGGMFAGPMGASAGGAAGSGISGMFGGGKPMAMNYSGGSGAYA